MKRNIIVYITTVITGFLFANNAYVAVNKLPSVNLESAFTHQVELIGNKKASAVLDASEETSQIASQVIYQIVGESLPKKYKSHTRALAATIVKEANKYGMDPLFLVSVIRHESTFNPDAIGLVGEIGLMQIRPSTAEWLNKKYKIVKKVNLKDPSNNVIIGAFYFNHLRDKFSQNSRWYISAYNMGATKLKRNIAQNIRPKEYVQNVMKYYVKYVKRLNAAYEKAGEVVSINATSTKIASID
ncbi:MAG: lytic transglycosylase domain-containing protein [Bdellovibrionales bacterium]|nr:lytic transglycosylase domain-containing protein [Bdellovibrionales bacterium]